MEACVIIPARYDSSRLPGKPLVNLLDKPMILWVAEIAAKAVGRENVFIATDDVRISNLVSKEGYKYIFTSQLALTGTDRVAEASLQLNYDIIINVQGDEPLISPVDIQECIHQKSKFPQYIINSYNLITPKENKNSKNIPKVVINESDILLYISRSLIPGFKLSNYDFSEYKKQVCIYGYSKKELEAFLSFGRKSELEKYEDIEILRFFELGYSIKMFKSISDSLAVDVKEDIPQVEKLLSNRNKL